MLVVIIIKSTINLILIRLLGLFVLFDFLHTQHLRFLSF